MNHPDTASDYDFNPDGGFTISWRRKWDNPVFRKKQEVGVWDWMCDIAQWEPKHVPNRKFGTLFLNRGELIIAEREVAEDFGMHRNTLRALLQRLVDDGMITLIRDRIPHRAGTVVRIEKYETYQSFTNVRRFLQGRKNGTARTEAGPKEDRSGTKNNESNKPKEEETYIAAKATLPTVVGFADGCVSPSGSVQSVHRDELPLLNGASVPAPTIPTSKRSPARNKDVFQDWMKVDWDRFKAEYPHRGTTNPNIAGREAFARLLLTGVSAEELVQASKAYMSEMTRAEKIGTQGVMHYSTFLSPKEEYWKQCLENEKKLASSGKVVSIRPNYHSHQPQRRVVPAGKVV